MFNQNDAVPGPTKEEIRIVTICKARLCEGSVVIDIGCGTGGLTVEAALQVAPKGKVYAVDEDEAAIKLTKSNVEKFSVQNNVAVTRGKAPEALLSIPNADAVFIGGGGISLRAIVQTAQLQTKAKRQSRRKRHPFRNCNHRHNELKTLGFKDIDITHISVAKGKQINSGTMMMARNPITIVSATKL